MYRTIARRGFCAILAACAWLAPNARAYDPILKYKDTPDTPRSAAFSVTVNDTSSITVAQSNYLSYSRFALSRPGAAVKIEVAAAAAGDVAVFPQTLGLVPTVDPTTTKIAVVLEGNLTGIPRKLVFRVGGKWLALFIDLPETDVPRPGDANVKNVMDFNPDNTGKTLQTSVLQSAIDWMAGNTQGKTILYFPNGSYLTGTLRVSSTLRIYLQDGAKIQGSGDPGDYAGPLLSVDGNDTASFKLYGRGVIDGDGNGIYTRTGQRRIRLLSTAKCARVSVSDVILRDENQWCFHAQYSADVAIRNVKVVGPSDHQWTDGFDVTSCANYRNENSFAWSNDDNTAIMSGTTRTGKVVFENLLGFTNCSGSRIGWNSASDIDTLQFDQCEWIQADLNALAFHQLKNGSVFGRIIFNRCRFDSLAMMGVFSAVYDSDFAQGTLKMDSLEFHQCRIEKQARTVYLGDPAYKIKKVIYDDTYIGTTRITALDQIQDLEYSNVGAFDFAARTPITIAPGFLPKEIADKPVLRLLRGRLEFLTTPSSSRSGSAVDATGRQSLPGGPGSRNP